MHVRRYWQTRFTAEVFECRCAWRGRCEDSRHSASRTQRRYFAPLFPPLTFPSLIFPLTHHNTLSPPSVLPLRLVSRHLLSIVPSDWETQLGAPEVRPSAAEMGLALPHEGVAHVADLWGVTQLGTLHGARFAARGCGSGSERVRGEGVGWWMGW